MLALETALDADIARYDVALADGGLMAFDDYVASGALDGIVIVRGGKVVYEKYSRMRSSIPWLILESRD